jgi:hypothetical protein
MKFAALFLSGISVASGELGSCHIFPCGSELLASCVDGQCTCTGATRLTPDGTRCESDGSTSLGDRLVLENDWVEHGNGGDYDALPLTVADALADRGGWNVTETCVPGRGREASNPTFANGLVNLFFGSDGVITGYEVYTPEHRFNGDVCIDHEKGSRCAIMFRRLSEITCPSTLSDGKGVAVTSIGDRLLFPYWGETGGELPLTVEHLNEHSPPFVDAESCLANMGHHFVAPLLSVNPVIPMYYEKVSDSTDNSKLLFLEYT